MEIKYKKLNIGKEEIAYLENDVDSKNDILFIHGNMNSSVCFLNLIKNLKDFKSYAVDMRGYGESSYYNKAQSIYDFVYDIKNFIIKKDISNFTIVSWSFGAGVALELQRDEIVKDKIKNMIFISPVGHRPLSSNGADILSNNIHEYLNSFDFFNLSKNLEIFSDIVNFNMSFIEDSIKDRDELGNNTFKVITIGNIFKNFIYNIKMPPKDEFNRNVYAAIKQRNIDEVASILRNYKYYGSKLSCDGLVIHGYDDKVISYMDGKFLSEDIGAEFIKLNRCGHSPMTDKFDCVLKAIKNFAYK